MEKRQLLIALLCWVQVGVFAQSQEVSPELKPFEFTLGKWEFSWYHLDAQTRKYVDDGKAYSTVTLIHNGMTYADEFYKKNADGTETRGTTFRSYDSVSKKLKLVWMTAGNLSTVSATGSQAGEDVVLTFDKEINDQYGNYVVRITFYDIQKDRYKWKQDFMYKDGTIIEKTAFYEARRIE